MASSLKNLSDYDPASIPEASGMKFGIVVAEWNEEITAALLEGCLATLKNHSVNTDDILVRTVPGTFELTLGAQLMAENKEVDAVICLGCVIQGETRHFDYICDSVTYGLSECTLNYNLPFIFGVLTTNNLQLSRERAGGRHGNKGDEAAVTAIKMIALKREMEK